MQINTRDTVWTSAEVTSPHLTAPVSVVVGRDVPYTENSNKRQTFTVYLPKTSENAELIGQQVRWLPRRNSQSKIPTWLVHIHGGAWRDPFLTSASIEAAVSHAFSEPDKPLDAIVSLNYTLSPFPTHPIVPYDPERDNHSDPSRDARHPDHVRDILRAFFHLRKFGLGDGSYILKGHSAGRASPFRLL